MASTQVLIGNEFPPSLEPEPDFRALLPERVRDVVFPYENIDALSFHGFSFPLQDLLLPLDTRWPGSVLHGHGGSTFTAASGGVCLT
jgi:hypothetical protein